MTLLARNVQAKSSTASFLSYERGRYALTDAYRLCGAATDKVVLIPAYHCRAMLDPALRLGARVRLYPLMSDLTPDLAALESIMREEGQRVVALLATHFFGLRQELSALVAICERFEVAVVEDCSHCLFTGAESSEMGSVGQYAVWSPYKFYPCEDGGLLQINRDAAAPVGQLQSHGFLLEVKRAIRLILRSRRIRNPLDLGELKLESQALTSHVLTLGAEVLESNDTPSIEYSPELERYRNLAVSRWIIARSDVPRIRFLRRRRYEQWLQATSTLLGCSALMPLLPKDCVPYMFPLYIEKPETHFPRLKQLGMPIWRWDNLAKSNCGVSLDYRTHLLQLPCHQELDDSEMAWMLAAVGTVLGGADPSTG